MSEPPSPPTPLVASPAPSVGASVVAPGRARLRDLGVAPGKFAPGPLNGITDVRGVRVGHSTVIHGDGELQVGKGPARTGVTAILPHEGDVYLDRVVGGGFILNGAGEVSGLTQVMEWGLIETPILLTNTLSVGTVSGGCVRYLLDQHPGIGVEQDVVLPLVGECDDSWLNDIRGGHVKEEHVYEAIRNANAGPVPEGNVGGGTGMITCDFKGGIGTSSRVIPMSEGDYTVGVLVMSNFGRMEDMRIDGLPVGAELAARFREVKKRLHSYGSIIAVVATDAPLWTHQLTRLAKRTALGIGRVGSYAAHGSGEIILSFSTANRLPRASTQRIHRLDILPDERMNPFYSAVIEATEEAILNAICGATEMEGANYHYSPALPLDEVREILARYPKVPRF